MSELDINKRRYYEMTKYGQPIKPLYFVNMLFCLECAKWESLTTRRFKNASQFEKTIIIKPKPRIEEYDHWLNCDVIITNQQELKIVLEIFENYILKNENFIYCPECQSTNVMTRNDTSDIVIECLHCKYKKNSEYVELNIYCEKCNNRGIHRRDYPNKFYKCLKCGFEKYYKESD
jgi:Zn finger protein HypA/HybF involved in hydrogenase expression